MRALASPRPAAHHSPVPAQGFLTPAARPCFHPMRTLLALGTALCLATAALPARADGPGEFQARARSLQLADDPAWAARAKAFSAKVCDLTEWFDRHGVDTRGMRGLDKVVTYHDACHLHHAQGVVFEPRRVLAKVPGVRYVELPEANWCCGSAGIYNVTHFAESVQLLDRKMANIALTGADVVVTGNPGCLLQLRYGIRRHGLNMEAWHTAEYLDRAYGEPSKTGSGTVSDGRG